MNRMLVGSLLTVVAMSSACSVAREVTPAPWPTSRPAAVAPDVFKVEFETTAGSFTVSVHREWAPRGADRFHELVVGGFYQDVAFFRVIDKFMAQFGIHGDPEVSAAWREAKIADDPVVKSNTLGTLTFATAGPGTRTTQLFLNFRDNSPLDKMGFAPIGKVVAGLDVLARIHRTGEGAPSGPGPSQGQILGFGNAYLRQEFPEMTYIKSARIAK